MRIHAERLDRAVVYELNSWKTVATAFIAGATNRTRRLEQMGFASESWRTSDDS